MGQARTLLFLVFAVGCGGGLSNDKADAMDGDSGTRVADARVGPDALPPTDSQLEGLSIPDPGTREPPSWEADYEQNFTPETAYPVGIVTENNPYVLAYIEPNSGDVFYVFRTGPDFTRLDIDLFGNKADVQHMHLHRGTDLIFGAKVADANPAILKGQWQLQTDAVYVLEIHTIGGGFV